MLLNAFSKAEIAIYLMAAEKNHEEFGISQYDIYETFSGNRDFVVLAATSGSAILVPYL